MSYIKHLRPEDINLANATHEEIAAACTEIQDTMGLNPAYTSDFPEDATKEWLSEAMDEWCVSDKMSDATVNTMRKVGYVMPGDEHFNDDDEEDTDGAEEDNETAAVQAEAESEGSEDEPVEKPVKKAKKAPKEPKAKKEPKPKKEKAPKEPKAPGVIQTLRGYVKEHGAEGFTLVEAHQFICGKFPDRAPDKLLATCRVQLQNSRMGKELGYQFKSVKDAEKKINTIYATPAPVVPAEEPAAEAENAPVQEA